MLSRLFYAVKNRSNHARRWCEHPKDPIPQADAATRHAKAAAQQYKPRKPVDECTILARQETAQQG
jgi:hypothetical protein